MTWKVAIYHGHIDTIKNGIRRLRLPVDYYRPTIIRPRTVGKGIFYVRQPLYYNYFFLRPRVEMDIEELQELLPISFVMFRERRRINGNGHKCEVDYVAELPDDQVEAIRRYTQEISESYRARFEGDQFANANVGADVVLVEGAFAGHFGKIIGPASNGQIWIEIIIFDGRPTRFKVNIAYVELVQ